jgi:DNA repair exonuclease SbcCD ATPase subunit
VPAFYRVLEDGAARLNVQCLAVSHHDLSAFAGQFHIAQVRGEPQHGVEVVSDDVGSAWNDEQSGMRFVRLINVQAYRDATLHLGPGVNALIGPNNRGKSTFIRALRAVFYGEVRDSLVRAGAKSATIEIGVAGRRVLRFSRQPRRSPVNIWSLHEADGSIVDQNGMRFETGGRVVPDWVAELFGITRVEELDVHIAHQKFPVFLLGETPSRRSAVLSIGQEASYIRDMLTIHRERCARDNTFVKAGERELIGIAETLARMADLVPLKAKVDEARKQTDRIAAAMSRLDALERQRTGLSTLRRKMEAALARARAMSDLPEPERLANLIQTASRTQERERIGRQVIDLAAGLERAGARRKALWALPDGLPTLENTAPAQDILSKLSDLRGATTIARGRLSQISEELKSVERDMAALIDETGGLCPTCGSSVDAQSLLQHSHFKAERVTA